MLQDIIGTPINLGQRICWWRRGKRGNPGKVMYGHVSKICLRENRHYSFKTKNFENTVITAIGIVPENDPAVPSWKREYWVTCYNPKRVGILNEWNEQFHNKIIDRVSNVDKN